MEEGLSEKEREHGSKGNFKGDSIIHKPALALEIGCICHGLDALQGTRAKPGNHLVVYKDETFTKSCAPAPCKITTYMHFMCELGYVYIITSLYLLLKYKLSSLAVLCRCCHNCFRNP